MPPVNPKLWQVDVVRQANKLIDIQFQIGFGPKQCHIALVIMVGKPIESLIYSLPLAKCAKKERKLTLII